jgi:hypothetical protein
MSKPGNSQRNKLLAVLLVVSPLLWTIPTFIYLRNVTAAQNAGCQSVMKSLGGALISYAHEHNGQLPETKNWLTVATQETGIKPHCPADIDTTHASSYAMNANLSGKKLAEIKNPSKVILLYETTSKAAVPFGTGKDMVRVGKDDVGVGRHHTIGYRLNYFVMADGSVRWPDNIAQLKSYQWKP